MKKILSALICAVMCIMSMTACGGGEMDINAVSQQLLSAQIFTEELTEVNSSVTQKRLGIDGGACEECIAYAGTKAVVDEIVIVKATDEAAAENIKQSLDKHIETQKKSYSSYRPDEVPKLEEAVSLVSGKYAVLVVSNDSAKALEIIKK